MVEDRYTVEIKAFGKKVKEARLRCSMTQLDLSVAIGKDRSEISKIENGKINIEFNTLVRLADALKLEIYDFFKP
jgi:transcriptional regulator with XRE-family HTH domain